MDRPRFKLHGIDCYSCVTTSEIPALLNRGYDYLILDMGHLAEADLPEFLRCERKLVLGSLAPWKSSSIQSFFERFNDNINLREGFYYIMRTGDSGELLRFSRAYHLPMHCIGCLPNISNPLKIKKEHFAFLEDLLSDQ